MALDWVNVDRDVEAIIASEAMKLDLYAERLLAQKYLDPRTVEVLAKVAERKARLLGLDAPEKKIIAGKFDINSRIAEVEPDFVAGVIQELDRTNRPALAAHHAESMDSAQANHKTGGVSTRATA